MDLIEIGQSVNIKRTDGRIHSAVVSKINPNLKSVTVEWYEKGETKGKEVELDAIMQLNANLFQEQHAAPEPKKQAINISREPSHSSIEEEDEGDDDDNDDEDDDDDDDELELDNNGGSNIENCVGGGGGLTNNHRMNRSTTGVSGGGGSVGDGTATIVTSTGTTSGSGGGGGGGGTLPIRQQQYHQQQTGTRSGSNPTQGAIRVMNKINAQNGHRTSRITLNCVGQSDHVENIPPQQPQPPQPPPSQLTGLSKSRSTHNATKMSQSGIVTSSSGGVGPRRSYVVKEVERLKENREKRRARQAELKEEKHALMNLDPGNPNWETSAMIREYQSTIEFRPLIDGQAIEDHQITVCVRKRPLSRKEVMRKEIDVISVPSKDQLIVHEPRNKVDLTKFLENHRFRFDYAFDDNCNNEIVYKYTAKPLVQTIFDGGMATCFAYGQTGSGKTHTMGGEFNGKVQDCKNGIYAMAAKDVFTYLNGPRYNHLNLVVSASFFEIYSGKVFDLLADKQKLRVLEDAKQQVQVVGLTEKVVDSVEDVLKLIQHGNSARTSGQTSANSNSSRSHAVFQIVLRPPGSNKIHGKFSFIDLAGNERGADTSSANRQTRMEGAEINKSLLALKECIRALGKQSAHLPFRVSKLTQVLRDSFIGEKSKTCMIAMISPGLSSCEHTLNTLRYADRVKELVVKDLNEMRNDDIEQMESDDHKNGQLNENELAHLRSISEHDMSDELFNQHAVISDLQQTEELVVDQHKAINEFLARFLPESRELYNLTNYVDYDQDAYCKRGEELFTQLADFASSCREAMSEFRSKLTKEEMLSHAIKPGKR